MPTLILGKQIVDKYLNMSEVIEAVEKAFIDWSSGYGAMPSKAYIVVEKGDFRAMPAALPGVAGVKWVNVHPGNYRLNLPTVLGTLIYSDPDTGYPLAIMDATEITAYRTGATAAIASKYLANKQSHCLGIVGAGHQAFTQILAHAELFNFDQIRVFDHDKGAIERLISYLPGYPLKESTLDELVSCDIICTVTTAHEPVLKRESIAQGTHINAIGADATGKQELEISLLQDSLVVVDDTTQSCSAGEINVAICNELFSADDIYGTLGDIISGKKNGRQNDESITIFDSTGIAIEDIAVAKVIYEKAKQDSSAISVRLVD